MLHDFSTHILFLLNYFAVSIFVEATSRRVFCSFVIGYFCKFACFNIKFFFGVTIQIYSKSGIFIIVSFEVWILWVVSLEVVSMF